MCARNIDGFNVNIKSLEKIKNINHNLPQSTDLRQKHHISTRYAPIRLQSDSFCCIRLQNNFDYNAGVPPMSEKKVLSVAEIARELEIPESTVHYWKNRFAQHLPSIGKGRQKRFRPEAVEVFQTIATMLREGHTARDVMEHLGQTYPIQADTVTSGAEVQLPVAANGAGVDAALKLATTIGAEIARSIGEGIRNVLSPEHAASVDVENIKREIASATECLAGQSAGMEELRAENTALKEKLSIMESELIRLRKDRREMEKYLLDKIKAVTT